MPQTGIAAPEMHESDSLGRLALAHIVTLVRERGTATRLELLEASSLGRAIIRQRVEQAIDLGLLEDTTIGLSNGGRAPRVLQFRNDRGLVLAAALGASSAVIAVTDLAGEVLASSTTDWDISNGPEQTLAHVSDEFDRLRSELPDAPVWGVGLGVPGPVDFTAARAVAPPIMPGWDRYDIRGNLEQRFSAPIWVDNDVNVLAIGECHAWPVAAANNLLFIKVGSGIGAGLMSSGHIHRGGNGAAGDIGHIAVAGSVVNCRCGRFGCLEATAGGWALVRDAEAAIAGGEASSLELLSTDSRRLTPRDIVIAAREGDRLSIDLLARSARTVGDVVATLVDFFNPSLVVIGGAVAGADDAYLATIRQTIYHRSPPLATRDLQVVRSSGHGLEGARGAAALVLGQLFGPGVTKWITRGTPVGVSGLY